MTIDEHKIEVEKLKSIENELTKLICSIDNDKLYNVYLDWQNQRLVCNEGFTKVIAEKLKQ